MRPIRWLALILIAAIPAVTTAQDIGAAGVSHLDAVQVTATRFALPVQETPNSMSLVSGDELRARGATDLRSALALLGGITVASGGDDGPAGSAPGLLGLREADDFLLLVDGIPAGAAFLPQFSTLDLTDVARIEVQRSAAPVFYGTTSFAGTINIIHYAAGQSAHRLEVRYGSFGTVGLSGSAGLGDGRIAQSLSGTLARQRYSDPRAGVDRAHLLYRVGAALDGGMLHADVDATLQHQRPASPSPVGDDGGFEVLPIDYNQNPSDAKIDTNRFQLNLGYDRGRWSTVLALSQTHEQRVQGALGLEDDEGGNAGGEADAASGAHQVRDIGELFLDSHVTLQLLPPLRATLGGNELYGLAHQGSRSFTYVLPDDGGPPPSSATLDTEDVETLHDARSFAGLYGQLRWSVLPRVGVLAGLRLNHLDQRRAGADSEDALEQSAHQTRLSGAFGADWRIWQDASADLDDVVLYAQFANSFQPAQVDFGPDDALNPLLSPESARSYEAGMKADGLDGRFDLDISGFMVDFDNQPMPRNDGLVPGGRQRYLGFEVESHYALTKALRLTGSFGYNDARYRDFSVQSADADDDTTQLSGHQLVLTPRTVGAVGVLAGGLTGPQFSLSANYVGRRFLDAANTLTAPAYETLDASIGWALPAMTITVRGTNLGNRRDPVLESELGQEQFYRLPSRRVELSLSIPLRRS